VSGELVAALDVVLRQIDRARAGGMRTLRGDDAGHELDMLQAEMARQRELVEHGNDVDAAWLRETIRWVATWAPETDLTLLGALGALARRVSPPDQR